MFIEKCLDNQIWLERAFLSISDAKMWLPEHEKDAEYIANWLRKSTSVIGKKLTGKWIQKSRNIIRDYEKTLAILAKKRLEKRIAEDQKTLLKIEEYLNRPTDEKPLWEKLHEEGVL